MRKGFYVTCVLGVIILSCAKDTATDYIKDGETYGVTEGVFRGRWWSYYERGMSFLAGEFHQEAATDFEKALKGRSRDTWQARTYGLHFTEYFPNRELGITYYEQGKLAEAEQYLESSLENIDTARAHHYLDLVMKQKIAKGEVKDVGAPVIVTSVEVEKAVIAKVPGPVKPVEKPVEPVVEPVKPVEEVQVVLIAQREMPIKIEASDDVGVYAVKVNDEPMHQRGSAEKVEFEKDILLKEGIHEIKIAATDLAGKEVVKTIKVAVDLTGPTIGIFLPTDPTVTQDTVVTLEGATVDKNGISVVSLDERIVAESDGAKRVEFSTDLPLSSGENSFILIAKDIAGNETRSAIKVFHGNPDSVAAKLWVIEQKHPELLQLAAAQMHGSLPALLASLDLLTKAVTDDEEKPRIKLVSPIPGKPYRHNRTLRIKGSVISPSKVVSLTINGEEYTDLVGAPKEIFDKRIPIDTLELKDGMAKIEISIDAGDDRGLTVKKQFEVAVRPIEMNSRDSKMPVALLPFVARGTNVTEAECERLRLETESRMLKAGRFRVLDRTHLETVLTEQQLASLADPSAAIAIGKIANIQAFLAADVFEHGAAGLEIKGRVISTETTDVMATLDVFIDDKNDAAKVKEACDAMSEQLTSVFPRLSGQLLSVKQKNGGTDMLVDWTKEDGILEGMHMLVVHETEPWLDEDTGEVLEEGEIVEIGRARVEKILKSSSKAKTIKTDEEGVKLEKGMAAITM